MSSVNHRSVFAMRTIGCDRTDLVRFCGVMDLPPPVHKTSYDKVKKTIENAAVEVQEQSMQDADKLEYKLANRTEDTILRDIDVSSDGTWMTPGHSSTVGVATTIGCVTGKVLGVGTRSKVCKSCQVWEKRDKNSRLYRRWRAQHVCTLNHVGSSESMEGAIVAEISSQSVEKTQAEVQ